jgi:hypothetical protein
MDTKQKLIVDGKEVTDLVPYALRWYGPGNPNPRAFPVLYLDGKRVTKPWHLIIDADVEADPSGGNANTA